ncbi:MAG: GTP 3',8-cyclase MoaA [Cyanobacteriota bacterium]
MQLPPLQDRLGRPLGVVRLSLTARCNLNCPYCLPESKDPAGMLGLEERRELVAASVDLGAHTLHLTGGEPLLDADLEHLIMALQPLRPRLRRIALTSNGQLLSAARAKALRKAGLDTVTLSLDGTDANSVARMSGRRDGGLVLEQVLAAIEHARSAGFDPTRGGLKLNAVIQRGVNEDQVLPLASLARQRGLELRLIEFMDVGNRNGWQPDQVVTAATMVSRIHNQWPLEPLQREANATHRRWRYRDGGGPGSPVAPPISTIAAISEPFCGDCNRLRITAEGLAFACLFASTGTDLRPWLRPRPQAADLRLALAELWHSRSDRYSEERAELRAKATSQVSLSPHAEMAYLGG